ncbi:MAG: class I SAM-dependent methyltransferase [Candidatus Hodarchaeales archaeon]
MENSTLKYYEKNSREITEKYENLDMKNLHQKLTEVFSKKDNLLELGCGSGRDAAYLISHGYDVIISDGSQTMLNEAIKLHPELKRNACVIQLPNKFSYPKESFSGVYAIAVLMHLEIHEIGVVLEEISRILTSDGKFFFSVYIRENDKVESIITPEGRFLTRMPKENWIKMCESSGFTLISLLENDDVMGRDIQWCSFYMGKTG